MAPQFSTSNALVLREVRYKEADRILTLFTSEHGKITAKAPGALRKNSKTGAGTQLLTFSEMILFNNRGKISVNEAFVKEDFRGLRSHFANYALGCYMAECVDAFADEDNPEPKIMQLILNSLYALSNNLHDPLKIKAAFELRLMCILGYTPSMEHCPVCGESNPVHPTLGIQSGLLCCRECRHSEIGITDYIDSESLMAMRYIAAAAPKAFLNFNISGESLVRLNSACEDYLLDKAERKFGTLEYWKQIR